MKRFLAYNTAAIALFVTASPTLADGLRFEARLSSAQEVGAVISQASGVLEAEFDEALSQVFVVLRVRNLVGTFAAAHFHCNRPGLNGPIAFGLVNPGPLAFVNGRVSGTLTNANFSMADCVPGVARPVNNIAALAFAMRDGLIYANVHTTMFPGGEIRGQVLEVDDGDDD